MTAPILEYFGFLFVVFVTLAVVFIVALAIAIIAATIGSGLPRINDKDYD